LDRNTEVAIVSWTEDRGRAGSGSVPPAQAYLAWAFERLGTHRDVFAVPLEALTPAAFKKSSDSHEHGFSRYASRLR
jgi:hypothetical protein